MVPIDFGPFKAKPQKEPVWQDTWTLDQSETASAAALCQQALAITCSSSGRNHHHLEGGEPAQGRHHLIPERAIVLANAAGEGEHVDPA